MHRLRRTFFFGDLQKKRLMNSSKVFFRRHGFRAWARTFSPPTFGLRSVTSLFVSEKRGAKSSLFWTRTYNFWGNACMKGENNFVTIWTNPTEPVLKLCFTLFEATSSTILCIGLSFTSQNYKNWEPELYLEMMCSDCWRLCLAHAPYSIIL